MLELLQLLHECKSEQTRRFKIGCNCDKLMRDRKTTGVTLCDSCYKY